MWCTRVIHTKLLMGSSCLSCIFVIFSCLVRFPSSLSVGHSARAEPCDTLRFFWTYYNEQNLNQNTGLYTSEFCVPLQLKLKQILQNWLTRGLFLCMYVHWQPPRLWQVMLSEAVSLHILHIILLAIQNLNSWKITSLSPFRSLISLYCEPVLRTS